MSRVCQVTGKRPTVGNRVSHANNKRRRRFLPNLHVHRFWIESERRFVSLRVSTRGLRTIVESVLLDTMYELPSLENVSKVVVDEQMISADGKPLLIYSDQHKVAGSSA